MGALSAERLEFSLLGPLAVAGELGPLELGAPKHRALLALLLLEPGRVVSVDRLIDQLWHGEPPAAATSTLQAYVSNLRRVLEPNRTAGAPATVLVTRPPGYVLDIAPEQVDAARFERNVTAAIEARERGRLDDAGVYLADALALWRGHPLADVAYESWAQSECERLKELHLVALETQLSIDLERGRHTSVAVEAERLAKEYPVRERFRELLDARPVPLGPSGRRAARLPRGAATCSSRSSASSLVRSSACSRRGSWRRIRASGGTHRPRVATRRSPSDESPERNLRRPHPRTRRG